MSFTFRFLKPGDPYYPNWVQLRRHRLRAWLAIAAWPVLALMLSVALLVVGPPGGSLLWGSGLAACLVLAARVRLVEWPCPRCGRPFYGDWWVYWPFANRCLHCGLPDFLRKCRTKTQLEESMDTILIPMLPLLVPFAFLLYLALHRVKCPDCGEMLPLFYSPFRKTRRMWRAGGYLCARCGCETDSAGRKVTPDAPLPPVPARHWVLLSVLLLVGLGLGTAGWFVTARAVPARQSSCYLSKCRPLVRPTDADQSAAPDRGQPEPPEDGLAR